MQHQLQCLSVFDTVETVHLKVLTRSHCIMSIMSGVDSNDWTRYRVFKTPIISPTPWFHSAVLHPSFHRSDPSRLKSNSSPSEEVSSGLSAAGLAG